MALYSVVSDTSNILKVMLVIVCYFTPSVSALIGVRLPMWDKQDMRARSIALQHTRVSQRIEPTSGMSTVRLQD